MDGAPGGPGSAPEQVAARELKLRRYSAPQVTARRHRIYLIPGMFGFGTLAGYDYFRHVRQALAERFAAAGIELVSEVVAAEPTASLRHRSRLLARTLYRSAPPPEDVIHLVGHSTGGLDARLVLSPSTNLGLAPELLVWTNQVRTALSLNCPHYGTPLAGYFATVSGTRLLYVLSLLTVVSLYAGEPSVAIFSRIVASIGGVDSLVGGDLRLLRRGTDLILRAVDSASRREVADFLSKVRTDQGGIIQIMPEASDLFNAATEDRPGTVYASVATAAPFPQPMRMVRRLWHPYAAMTAAIYATMYQFASQKAPRYAYASPSAEQRRMLAGCGTEKVTAKSNDGVVPTLSMIYGRLLWCGEADHLDVLGHFHDDERPPQHFDWMTSGAHYDRRRFAKQMDAIASCLLQGTES